jgi:hypothetical protein
VAVAAVEVVGASVAVVENTVRAVEAKLELAMAAAGWVSADTTSVSTTDVAVIDEAGAGDEPALAALAGSSASESLSATVVAA